MGRLNPGRPGRLEKPRVERVAPSALIPALLTAAAFASLSAAGCRKAGHSPPPARVEAVRLEGQPAADLGDGRFRNPVLAGEFPDPSLVRVGGDYYMTHTPGAWTPGLLIWHSRDLVNWVPLGYAVSRPVGDIWAPDLVHHNGLFYIYFPARVREEKGGFRQTCFVTTAADSRGPWTEPVDLEVAAIDPGHAADEKGGRFLYVDGGRMIRLAPVGLRTEGGLTKVYNGWDFPGDWDVECKCLESPKISRRGGFFYLVSAHGGTAGPSKGHMIVVARSESSAGPWENSPYNPLLRTASRRETWWSQGHGTIFEAADGSWWVIYHAYEDVRTLGRQMLPLPVEWTNDGWPGIRAGTDPAAFSVKTAGADVGHGLPLSDDFSGAAPGLQLRQPVFGGGLSPPGGLRRFGQGRQPDEHSSGQPRLRGFGGGERHRQNRGRPASLLRRRPFHRRRGEAGQSLHLRPGADSRCRRSDRACHPPQAQERRARRELLQRRRPDLEALLNRGRGVRLPPREFFRLGDPARRSVRGRRGRSRFLGLPLPRLKVRTVSQ